MARQTESSGLRPASFWALALLGSLSLLIVMPAPDAAVGLSGYLPLHIAMEVVAIAVAAMIFGICWATQKHRPDGRFLVLGLGFLGVALLDMSHTLSFPGMPTFITPSGTEKAIHFWFAARSMAAAALLWMAFWPLRWDTWLTGRSRLVALLVLLGLVTCLHYVFLFHPERIPRTFVEGQGLTPFKVGFEYGLIALYLVAAVGFLTASAQGSKYRGPYLSLASFTMAMSEFFFTKYANVTDVYNVAGHIYKVIAYGFLYRGLFVESIRKPYEQLVALESQQRATLNTLPDLLFEIDRRGTYLSIHAADADKLAAPAHNLIGRNIRDVLPPQAAERCMQALEEAQRLGASRGMRISIPLPQGLRHFELAVAQKHNSTREDDTYLVLSHDITATVEHEQRIAFEAQLNAALLDLEKRNEHESELEFLQRGAELAARISDSGASHIYLVGEGTHTIEPVAAQHGSSQTFPDIHEALERAVRQREPIVVHATTAQPLRVALLPALDGGQVRLVLCVGDKPEAYSDSQLQALHVLADAIWSYTKQRRQEAVIHRLYKALDQNPYPVLITDESARIVYVNAAFSAVSGYGVAEALGRNPRFLQSGQTPASTYDTMWRRLVKGLPWQGEFVNRRKDGQVYFESALVYPVRNALGETTHYVAHKEDITERRAAQERIRALSEFDALTGLLNKKVFDERLTETIARAHEHHDRLFLLWLDLDNFKVINETLGHAAGDELLVEVANRLRSSLGPPIVLARYSGDTFAAIVPGLDQSSVALMVEEALRHLQTSITIQGKPLSATASVGIAMYPNDAQTAGALASAAEMAMYKAKQEGRNGLRFFAPAMQAHTQRSLELAEALKHAVQRGELHLMYQPQCALSTKRLVGVEALLRWQHPTWGMVSPAEFIPIAEQTGAIVPIGLWVMEQAVRQMREWDAVGLSGFSLAVNVSAVQFATPRLVEEFTRMVHDLNVPAERIEIELTEAVALRSPELAAATIQGLHEAGFRVSLDDFGTGYSSMSYLKRYAIGKLKIDQSFVKDLASSASDQALVTAIVRMAQSLQMTTIAEGVETQEQALFLYSCGCNEVQGYWYSPPLDAAAFADFARASLDPAGVEMPTQLP
ncbi:EAL domain-containing protein [Caldimonas caldifontis]|uniref:GGDEF domain-containing protein n=1 Tax=Caldimonas caldifontis TaxID=1452508 RepID=A0A2S5SWE8_9BURK|nr:EAL domain-containing protein [Caldimonas caldifontis]PPE67052.1 GGDEF domain-containing protein [Caldimonas caldifontis]